MIGESRVEKILGNDEKSLLINPVEPINLPVPLCKHLEIAFPAIVLRPGTERKVYLTFPVEIGVFLGAEGDYDILDLFSFAPVKFSLYGTPNAGIITRWYYSRVGGSPPAPDRHREGVLELTLKNRSADYIEVSRTIFERSEMRIFYGEIAAMAAVMEIYSHVVAQTRFPPRAPFPGLTESLPLYSAQKIPVVQHKGFLMEHGVA
nr:DUF432 domain-containing protein [Methanolinea mesophila]